MTHIYPQTSPLLFGDLDCQAAHSCIVSYALVTHLLFCCTFVSIEMSKFKLLIVICLCTELFQDSGATNIWTRKGRQDEDDQEEESAPAPAPAKKVVSNKTVVVEEVLPPVTIGSFRAFVHAIDSSDVIILDEKTLEIPDFSYDGEGPASWFVVGADGEYTREMVDLGEYTVLPDENEGCNSLRRYNGETIKLTLPGKLKVSDISYLSVYCLRFNHNFGYVVIPDDIKAPKAGKDTSKVEECENVESGENTGGSGSTNNRRPAQGGPPASRPANSGGGLIGGLLNLLG